MQLKLDLTLAKVTTLKCMMFRDININVTRYQMILITLFLSILKEFKVDMTKLFYEN